MILAIQGTRTFDDYSVFLRAMFTALTMKASEDKEFVIYTAGPLRINQMTEEYINVSNFRARGIKARFLKVTEQFIRERIDSVDYVVYFCSKGEPFGSILDYAEEHNVENAIYRF